MKESVRSVLMIGAALAISTALVASGSASMRAQSKPTGAITVSAAASLTEAFTQIGTQFEKKNPETDVTFNFDASSALVGMLAQSAGTHAAMFAPIASALIVLAAGLANVIITRRRHRRSTVR